MITAVIRNRENTHKGLFGNLILTELNHFFYISTPVSFLYSFSFFHLVA